MLDPAPIRAPSFDAVLPPEMAERAEAAGVAKANRDATTTFILAVLAGAFIAWGGAFATTVTTDVGHVIPFGISKLLGGLVFCVGLVLVVVAGAELFTGNNLIVMAWASRRISLFELLRNWGIVYFGNFVGAALTACLIYLSGFGNACGGAVGETALRIAHAKCELSLTNAFFAGVACNTLVCLAVWLCLSARSVTDKILAIVFPISAFVATGMEHCVANMYFVPLGLLLQGDSPNNDSSLTLANFLANNLVPVSLGNIVGGAMMVGLVYWFVYLRKIERDK